MHMHTMVDFKLKIEWHIIVHATVLRVEMLLLTHFLMKAWSGIVYQNQIYWKKISWFPNINDIGDTPSPPPPQLPHDFGHLTIFIPFYFLLFSFFFCYRTSISSISASFFGLLTPFDSNTHLFSWDIRYFWMLKHAFTFFIGCQWRVFHRNWALKY